MLKVDVEIQGQERLGQALRALPDVLSDLRPAWPKVSQLFYDAEKAQFDSRGSRGGEQWPELSASYARWKSANYAGQPLMELTGNLRRSLTERSGSDSVYEATKDSLVLGTSDPKANAHQFGSGRLPRREVIALTDEDHEKMREVMMRELSAEVANLGFEVIGGGF